MADAVDIPSTAPPAGGPDANAISGFYESELASDTAALADLGKEEQASAPQPPAPPPEKGPGITSTAPFLIGLTALAGRAIGLHATAMLGATNGMVSGLIQGNDQKYKDSKAAYDSAYQQYRDKWDAQQKIFNEMRQVYKGRVDADLKALQFARQVTGDNAKVNDRDVKNYLHAGELADRLHRTDIEEAYKQGELLLKKRKLEQAIAESGATLSPDAIALAANRLANGERVNDVLGNMGRGKQGAANITAVQNAFAMLSLGKEDDPKLRKIAEDIATQKQILAAEGKERQVEGSIAGKIRYAEEEITRIGPKVLETSVKVPRGQWVPWNELKQKALTASSDPNLKQLKSYLTTLSNSYDLLAARGGTDVEKRKHNREMLDSADGPEALKAAVDAIMQEGTISGEAADASMRPRQKPEEKPVYAYDSNPSSPTYGKPTHQLINGNWVPIAAH